VLWVGISGLRQLFLSNARERTLRRVRMVFPKSKPEAYEIG